MLDRDPQQRLDELIKDDLAGHRLRGLEHRPGIQPLDGRANDSGGRCWGLCVAEMRMKLFELPDLAERAPANIAAPRLPQIRWGDRIEAARRAESRRQLMAQGLVLYETVVARRSNGPLVQMHGVEVSPLEARDFSGQEGVLVGESRWIVVGPLAQLFQVRRQEFAPSVLRVGSRVLVERRHRQRGVVKVFE